MKMAPNEKYQSAREKLLLLIEQTEDGMPLPNRTRLADDIGVSRMTLERAIAALVGEGILDARNGSGTYVSKGALMPHPINVPPRPRDEKTWALIISSVTHFSYPSLIRGLEDYASSRGISLVICNTDNLIVKQDDYLNKLLSSSVSGIIIVSAWQRGTNWRLFDRAIDEGVSIVTCNRQVPGYEFPGILMNFYQSGFIVTNHLIEQGCQRIAFISSPNYSAVVQRYQGYLTALDHHDRCDPLLTNLPDLPTSNEAANTNHILRFLEENPDIDGIFAFNDVVAVLIYSALKALGRLPGRDVKIVSCDNTDLCTALHVPLSSVEFPNYRMGRMAGEMMTRLRNGEPPEGIPLATLPARLIVRESSQ